MRASSRAIAEIGAGTVRLVLLGAALSIWIAPGVMAQAAPQWTVWAEAYESQVRVAVQADLPPDEPNAGRWRMYALGSPRPSRAVEITFDKLPEGLVLQDSVRQAGALSGYDPYFEKTVVYFQGQGLLWADFAARSEVVGDELGGVIAYMICNDLICLPPTEATFSTTISAVATPFVGGPSPRPAAEGGFLGSEPSALGIPFGVAQDSQAGDFAATDASGLWGFLLLAIGAGLGAFLMPCVYPMIPLTVSYFAKQASASAVRMALVYGFAIVTTFTGLGVLMSILVSGAGAQSVAANPWVNLFIAAAFIAFALSLFGLFELRLPSSLVNWVGRRGRESSGYAGVVFMGLTLTLVSFSCTVPFVGLLLPSIAEGAWFYGILGMATFSTTFALPFVAFASFPRALKALPGSGGWMRAAAVVFGFVELAAALKFISNADLVWGLGLVSRPLAIAFWTVLAALTGFYLIGQLRLKGDEAAPGVGAGRLLLAVAFFGLALYMIPGLFGGRLGRLDAYLPPRGEDDMTLFGDVHQNWITDDIPTAFAEAAAQDLPVMIDFTGYTCTNCREMEVNVFERGEVARQLNEEFVLLRLYTDGPRAKEFQQYQLDLTGTLALPTYAIVSSAKQDKPLVQQSGVMSSGSFSAFLDAGRAEYFD